MVDEGQLDEFEARGIVRLRGVFSEDDAASMREVVWREWEADHDVVRGDPSTWKLAEPWKVVPKAKRSPVFRGVLGEPLREFADVVLGTGWTVASGFGNLLTSFPDADTWRLPGLEALWHSDSGYQRPMTPLPQLRVFAVFGDMQRGGGGTLLVGGSHRMVERFVHERPNLAARRTREARIACHKGNAWLEELTRGSTDDRSRASRFMDMPTDVDGIAAQVIEVCGRPGDVFVCHPWTIHCRPPNASDRPRFIRSPTLGRRPEIARTP